MQEGINDSNHHRYLIRKHEGMKTVGIWSSSSEKKELPI
jgi:hypothetical protein